MLKMNFKTWFLFESTVIQSLNKQLAKLQDKGIVIDEDLKGKIRNVQNEFFHFLTDEKKKKEIFDWMMLQCIGEDEITDVLNGAKPDLNRDLFNTSLDNLSSIMNDSRDYLASKYESINFKDPKFNRYKLREENIKWHRELSRSSVVGTKGAWGKPIIKFPNGWSWVDLEKHSCPIEGATMGHCGNSGGKTSDKILSLRDEKNVPHLTFIDVGNGVLGEMKGRQNSKPKKEYHPYIIKLLESPYVNKILGGGYNEINNFNLYDLDEDERNKLIAKKPNLNITIEDVMEQLITHDLTRMNSEQNRALMVFLIKNNLIEDGYGDLKSINVVGKFSDKLKIYENYKKLHDYFEKICHEEPQDFLMPLLGTKIKIPLWLIDAYAYYLLNHSSNLSDIRSQDLTILQYLYDNEIESFDSILKRLSRSILLKSKIIKNMILSNNYIMDEKYLKLLTYPDLEIIFYDLTTNLFDFENHTFNSKLKNLKSKNKDLYDMIEKQILLPAEHQKERLHGMLHDPETRPAGYQYASPSNFYATDMSYEKIMSEILKGTLLKIFNNEELNAEDRKILQNNFGVEIKSVKEIKHFVSEFVKDYADMDENKINGLVAELLIILNHFYDYHDVLRILGRHIWTLLNVPEELASKDFIFRILENIHTFSMKTKKIMLKFVDELMIDEEKSRDGSNKQNKTIPYFDYEDYVRIKKMRDQIKEKYHI